MLTRFALAGVTNYVACGVAESGWEANGLAAFADSPATNVFTVANSNVTVYAKAYRDLNRNGEYDEGADVLLDWWEHLHSDAGFSSTNSADALLDPDGDGLLNLHEYWADCNPLAPDGSNTVLSAMSRSIDDRIRGRTTNDLSNCVYLNYTDPNLEVMNHA